MYSPPRPVAINRESTDQKERGSHAMNLDLNRFNEWSSHATESRSDFGVQRIQRIQRPIAINRESKDQ